ncbi:MAG TPA: HAD family hydrolase [Elusimicrobiales bacterium]|mgnify:CR=1 FL=1|nr:HAD family hydrolase [Elusimicrobiales bacterium]
MSSENFDLVVFDLDGTLTDSMACLADWLHRAVEPYCPGPVTPADITRSFGPAEIGIISQFVGPERVPLCLDAYYELYEREHDRVLVYPGISALLDELKRRGLPLALCTGKGRRAVNISLRLLGWDALFDVVITGDDTRQFKPDPEGLNLILARTRFARERVLFVGDSAADIAAADGAGIVSGHARWGLSAPAAPFSPRPQHLLNTPQAVLAIL